MAKKEAVVTVDATRYWWLLILEGLMAMLIGWWLLSRPVVTTLFLVQFLGLYWLLVGIIDIVRSLVEKEGNHRAWQLFGGLVGILASLFVLNHQLFAGVLTPVILLWIMAMTFVFNGLIQLFLGNLEHESHHRDRAWSSFFIGIFYVVIGLTILALPLLLTVTMMMITIGLIAVVGGVGMLVFSFRLRKLKGI